MHLQSLKSQKRIKIHAGIKLELDYIFLNLLIHENNNWTHFEHVLSCLCIWQRNVDALIKSSPYSLQRMISVNKTPLQYNLLHYTAAHLYLI